MCGIAGAILDKNFNRSKDDLLLLRVILSDIFRGLHTRGNDASGIAVISRDKKIKMVKSFIPSVFAMSIRRYADVIGSINNNTHTVLLHARKSTKGKNGNENNHPFHIGSIVGIHNGTISNAEQLFKKYSLTKKLEVDSEIIFALANSKSSIEETLDEFKEFKAPYVGDGTFAAAWIDTRSMRTCVCRDTKPVSVVRVDNLGVTIFASTEWHLDPVDLFIGDKYINKIPLKVEQALVFNDGSDYEIRDFKFGSVVVVNRFNRFNRYFNGRESSGWWDDDNYGRNDDFDPETAIEEYRSSINKLLEDSKPKKKIIASKGPIRNSGIAKQNKDIKTSWTLGAERFKWIDKIKRSEIARL